MDSLLGEPPSVLPSSQPPSLTGDPSTAGDFPKPKLKAELCHTQQTLQSQDPHPFGDRHYTHLKTETLIQSAARKFKKPIFTRTTQRRVSGSFHKDW